MYLFYDNINESFISFETENVLKNFVTKEVNKHNDGRNEFDKDYIEYPNNLEEYINTMESLQYEFIK